MKASTLGKLSSPIQWDANTKAMSLIIMDMHCQQDMASGHLKTNQSPSKAGGSLIMMNVLTMEYTSKMEPNTVGLLASLASPRVTATLTDIQVAPLI